MSSSQVSSNGKCSPCALPLGKLKRKQPAPMVEFDLTITICCAEDDTPDAGAEAQRSFTTQEGWLGCITDEPEADTIQQEILVFSGGYCRRRPLSLLTPSSCASNGSTPMATPGSAVHEGAKRQRTPKHLSTSDSSRSFFEGSAEGSGGGGIDGAHPQHPRRPRRLKLLALNTPSSCSSTVRLQLSPRTPDPVRADLKLLTGRTAAILFDFDGTLTATPGDALGNAGGRASQRGQREVELCARASLLAPHLRALHEAGIILGIISKSSEATIRYALRSAGLTEHFQGPILGSAIGLEGKAGFIMELLATGSFQHLSGCGEVLLIDDDVRELDRARSYGIQTYPAPLQGGLQDCDFVELFDLLGLQTQSSPAADLTPVATTSSSPMGAGCGGA